jgi:hypothetical protein
MDKILLSQAAMALRVSRERAMRLVLSGQLEGELVAGRWLVTRASLDRFLARQNGASNAAVATA